MLRISFFIGFLYSVCQIPVNEAPFLSIDPGLDIEDLSADAFEQSFELGYAPFLALLSVWFLAYRKLQKETKDRCTFLSEEVEAVKGSPNFPGSEPIETPKVSHCPPPKAVPKCPPRAKAKGKAPPPKGAPPRKAPSKAGEATPKAGTRDANPFGARRVRWRALQSATGTVFAGLGAGQLRNETAKMLNEVFKVTPQGQTARSSPFVRKSSGVCLLDRNRAQQLAIVFRRSPVPLQKLCSALLMLDFSIPLGEEEIEGLLQAWPTALDFQLIDKYAGPIEELRDVEQCIKQMSAVPRSEARLKLLRLSRSLDGLGHLVGQFEVLRCACEELLKSKSLRLLLEEALILGNYINGDAGAGFSLDAFIQLKSLKGAAGTTALHCLCASCAQEDPAFCSKLTAELGILRSAAQISLGTLHEALQRIKSDVESAAVEFAKHANEYDSTLKEVPLAPIQPLGSSKLGLPCKIPPLHLQMLQAEQLPVTFKHSGEEETPSSPCTPSPADALAEIGARSARTPRARSVNSRTRTNGTSESKSPRVSPQCSPDSCSLGTRTPVTAVEPPAKPVRFAMPPLRLPSIDQKDLRPNALCTPRRPHGSMIREAPPLRSARGGQPADDTPRSPVLSARVLPMRIAPAEEDAWRLYVEGLPAVTPRCPAPLLTARSEATRSFVPHASSPLSPRAPGLPPRPEVAPQAASVFIRNVTAPAPDTQKCCNTTERYLCHQKTSNGTCGIPAPVWSELGCNGTAPLNEGPLLNGTCDGEGEDQSTPTSSRHSGGPRAQLHALVARGRILLKRTSQDVAEMSKAISSCERFFGGLSADAKDGGIPLLAAAVEVLNAFQQAWEEVHRDDRWARFLPMASVRTTARSEASTSRRRKFTPRRSLP